MILSSQIDGSDHFSSLSYLQTAPVGGRAMNLNPGPGPGPGLVKSGGGRGRAVAVAGPPQLGTVTKQLSFFQTLLQSQRD